MPDISKRGTTTADGGARSRASRARRRARRHDEAVIQAEVRHVVRALEPYGVLHRDALERVSGAGRWREGGFDRAVSAAVRAGVLERLPAGFIRISRRAEQR